MQSPWTFAAGLVLPLGVSLAFVTGVVFGDGAEDIIHLTLGAAFLLLAFGVFDFKLPIWMMLAACGVAVTLSAIFLFQLTSDLLQSAQLRHLAYDVLGQRLEKLFGYAFLLWCAAMLLSSSAGKIKMFGAFALAVILCVEVYSLSAMYAGREAAGALKLLYLPLFVWLLFEGIRRRRVVGPATTAVA